MGYSFKPLAFGLFCIITLLALGLSVFASRGSVPPATTTSPEAASSGSSTVSPSPVTTSAPHRSWE